MDLITYFYIKFAYWPETPVREMIDEEQRALLLHLKKEQKSKQKEAYRVEDIAEKLGVSAYTARKWLREGKIGAKKVGRLWLVPKSEIDRLFETGR